MPTIIDGYNGVSSDISLNGIETTDQLSNLSKLANNPVLQNIQNKLGSALLDDKHDLAIPNTSDKSMNTIKGLSEDAIMTLLGFENNKSQIQSAQSTLKTHAAFKKQENQELINKLQEQAKKIDEESKLSPLKKLFKIIGAALGAVVGIAACVATGGSALAVVGAVIGCLLAADNIASVASDGKYCLAGACTKIFGEKAGPWVAMGISIALTIASLTCSIKGAVDGARTVANKVGDVADKISNVSTYVKNVSNVVTKGGAALTAVSGIGSSITDIVSACNQKSIAFLKADQKVIQALMNELNAMDEREVRRLKELLENQLSNTQAVKDIVDDVNAATQSAVTA